MSFSWTDEHVDRLTSMWRKGFTARQIAEQIGGVTRNAVIGKAHRLGLSQRPQVKKRENTLLETNIHQKTCQWPFGEPNKHNFYLCGDKVTAGKPYCQKHCNMAYRTVNLANTAL